MSAHFRDANDLMLMRMKAFQADSCQPGVFERDFLVVDALTTPLELIIPLCSPVVPTHVDESMVRNSLLIDEFSPRLWVRWRRQALLELLERSLRLYHASDWFHPSGDHHPHHRQQSLSLLYDRIKPSEIRKNTYLRN